MHALCSSPPLAQPAALFLSLPPNPENHHRFVNIKKKPQWWYKCCVINYVKPTKGLILETSKSLHWLKSWFKHNRNRDFGVKINLKHNFKCEVVSFRLYVVGSQNTSASYLVMYFRKLQVCQWLTPSSFLYISRRWW